MPARIFYPLAVVVLAAAALAAALIGQYVYGLLPCVLCLYQRVPFYLALALGLGALLPPVSDRGRALLLALAGLALVVNAGIAAFHVGVEQHWWAGTSACGGGGIGGIATMSVEDLMQAMNRPPEVRCDQPSWSFHGITMAMMNVPFSLAFGLATLVAARTLAGARR